MTENPWKVDSIQDFLCFKCPECDFNSKLDDVFEEHAIENHPLSFTIFGKTCKEEELDPMDYLEDNYFENYANEDATNEEKWNIVDPLAHLRDVKPNIKGLVEYSYKQKKRERKQKFNHLSNDENVIAAGSVKEEDVVNTDNDDPTIMETTSSKWRHVETKQYSIQQNKSSSLVHLVTNTFKSSRSSLNPEPRCSFFKF